MSKKQSTTATLTGPKTWDELGRAIDLDGSYAHRLAKGDDWPVARKGPWSLDDVQVVLAWKIAKDEARVAKMSDDDDPDSIGGLRKQKLIEEIEILKLTKSFKQSELDVFRALLLKAEDVQREWVAIGVGIRNDFQNLPAQIIPRALTHGLPHGAANTLQREIEAMVAAVLRKLSEGDDEQEDEPREAA